MGGKLLGWSTVCAVELDSYCRSVLLARQADGHLPRFPIWDDVCTFDGRCWRGSVDIVTGGFPCQDISSAGSGAGIEGERSSLWFQMARIIREVQPRFVFVENSPMLTHRGLGSVLGSLAQMGFDARWGVYSAADAGAPHLRKRIWILGDADGNREPARAVHAKAPGLQGMGYPGSGRRQNNGLRPRREGLGSGDAPPGLAYTDSSSGNRGAEVQGREEVRGVTPCRRGQGGRSGAPDVADALEKRCRQTGNRNAGSTGRNGLEDGACEQEPESWWKTKPRVGRLVNGLAYRVDRLKALGNGQVPAVVRLAWEELSRDR